MGLSRDGEKRALELSIEKTTAILDKLPLRDIDELEKYSIMLVEYITEYKIVLDKSWEVKK